MGSVTIIARPPVVAILGHVDHGKTSLLDKIRNTSVTQKEAGGITQSIGAWQVVTKDGKAITFIDTPGHAAFEGMRSRGAKIADIAVLVIAADDGVMPQTKQSIEFIKESKTPFLVAITKTDLPGASIDKVKNQLLELEIVPEEYGGETVVISASGKTGEGIDHLLEMIGIMSEMHEISGSPKANLQAYVLETEKDHRRGVVFSVVVKNGTLKIGDMISVEGVNGKVRGLFDESGKGISEVGPSGTAQVIGLATLPQVGSLVAIQGEKMDETQEKVKSLNVTEGFPVILKADTAGSLEAIVAELENPESGLVGVLSAGLGDIAESDIQTASATGATVVGFNVKVSKEVQRFADEEKVKVYTYKIIYELFQDIERWIKEVKEAGMERILGRAQIIAVFPHGRERIAGCKIIEGRVVKTDRLRLKRADVILGNVKIETLKKQKQDVDKAETGDECGIFFEPQFDFQVGDVLESVQV